MPSFFSKFTKPKAASAKASRAPTMEFTVSKTKTKKWNLITALLPCSKKVAKVCGDHLVIQKRSLFRKGTRKISLDHCQMSLVVEEAPTSRLRRSSSATVAKILLSPTNSDSSFILSSEDVAATTTFYEEICKSPNTPTHSSLKEALLEHVHTKAQESVFTPPEFVTKGLEAIGAVLLFFFMFRCLFAGVGFKAALLNSHTIDAFFGTAAVVAQFALATVITYGLHVWGQCYNMHGLSNDGVFAGQVLMMVIGFASICWCTMGLDMIAIKLALVMLAVTWLLKMFSFAATSAAFRRVTAKGMLDGVVPISMVNFSYFLVAPSLVFQTHYPRTAAICWAKVMGYALEIVALATISYVVSLQLLSPAVVAINQALAARQIMALIGNFLILAMSSTIIWVCLVGYGFFHVHFHLVAELTSFDDRLFYKKWWTCCCLREFWALWNMPVHNFLKRHVLSPMKRMNCHWTVSFFVVFLVSAVFHEVVPLVVFNIHRVYDLYFMYGPWAFHGMMAQVAAIPMTDGMKKKPRWVGNAAFWVGFCILGQPIAILLYSNDLANMAAIATAAIA